jgi:hypothetical protein
MLIGINYPWIDYGWDFGPPPPMWVPDDALPAWRARKRGQIEKDFRQFASQGIFAVRWFLLADGTNYGMGEFAPKQEGGGWTFDPLPVGHPFYEQLRDDFAFVLQACARNGLKFFPSLIDFHWCGQGHAPENSPGIIKCGRHDIIRNPAKRNAFLERILEPLLEASAQCPDLIYAWELINEPEWAVRNFSLSRRRHGNRNVPLEEMREFIAEGVKRINAKRLPSGGRAFRSSVGFAHWNSLQTWDAEALGITLPQFHYYAQKNGALPPHRSSSEYSCVLGEFATAVERDWPDLKRLHRDQTVASRLGCIEQKGYPACFMWSARAADVATRWTTEEHQGILAYARQERPGGRA